MATTHPFALSGRSSEPEAVRADSALLHPIRPLVALWAFLLTLSAGQDIALGLGLMSDKVWIFDVDVETGLYTWFSVLLLAGAALATGVIALERKAAGDPLRFHWLLLAAIFLALSADEACALHEAISGRLTSGLHTSGALYFAWVIPAGIAAAVGLFAFVPFIRAFPPALRALLLGSAAMFLAGAIGMEMIAGAIGAESEAVMRSGPYRALVNLEEAMEGGAVILYLAVLVALRRRESPLVTLRLG
ncbi:hypothetical protein ACLBKU_08125 [Erythrobacter sp. NE805]|uniref:hypothetical protein n=1 Tax=Erythrobacter sp. NE805 TaxID=3389875 RepID=UPI00396B3ECD